MSKIPPPPPPPKLANIADYITHFNKPLTMDEKACWVGEITQLTLDGILPQNIYRALCKHIESLPVAAPATDRPPAKLPEALLSKPLVATTTVFPHAMPLHEYERLKKSAYSKENNGSPVLLYVGIFLFACIVAALYGQHLLNRTKIGNPQGKPLEVVEHQNTSNNTTSLASAKMTNNLDNPFEENYNAHDLNLVNSQGLATCATWGEIGGKMRLTKIDADGKNLDKKLSGSLDLSDCTALTALNCRGNSLTSLNVSGCTSLSFLTCDNNKISTLNVSGCMELRWLHCDMNSLTSLDVSENLALITLWCSRNKLTSVDISSCTELHDLSFGKNFLTSLDVSKNTRLSGLYCQKNSLTSLDVSNNLALKTLWCFNNSLTSLDVSKNKNLSELFCEDNSLTFAVLPIFTKDLAKGFKYSPQKNVQIGMNGTINQSNFSGLQSQYNVDGKTTTYTWYNDNGNAIDSNLITDNNGVFTFDLSLNNQSVYCKMTNTVFPNLTLTTETVKIVAVK